MPDRYHIHTALTPARFHRIGKFGGIDWREDCSRCTNCVKPRCCYDVYKHETIHNRDPFSVTQPLYECKACLSCVQGCTKGLLSLSVNPEYLDIGDEYWKPDVIANTWNQADSGKIPVSGAGYRGRFHGPGFDSIWTDMSEIVRPTRDGIHGREYISTSVDIGSKPMYLRFTPEGKMLTQPSRLLEIPIPVILDVPPWPIMQAKLAEARAMAARELGTVAVMFAGDAAQLTADQMASVVPILSRDDIQSRRDLVEKNGSMVQLLDAPDVRTTADFIRTMNPQSILSVRLTLSPKTAERILDLSREGIKVFHLCADLHGRERVGGGMPGRHIKDALRETHGRLVQEGLRDEITLIASGGIALAEHMAKAIICGADLVAVDAALLVALGCRVCRNAHPLIIDMKSDLPGNYDSDSGINAALNARPGDLLIHDRGGDCLNHSSSKALSRSCPIATGIDDVPYATQRMVNLMGAWHSQLIEVLGAMGIREVRRLRGEVGRAIFMEEIEKEAFGDLMRVSLEQVSA